MSSLATKPAAPRHVATRRAKAAPLSPRQIGAMIRADAAARDPQADDAPALRAGPAPRATAHMAEARRDAARQIAQLAELTAAGGARGVDFLSAGGGAGGAACEGPQARVAWALTELRRIAGAIGADVVRLDAMGGRVAAIDLVRAACIRDAMPAAILAGLGLKRSRGRQRALVDGLDAALGRAAVALGLETPPPRQRAKSDA